MKRLSSIFIGWIAVLALVFATGCSGDEGKGNLPSGQSGATKAKKEAAFDETAKWNAYVDLSNKMHGKFFGGYKKYVETFGNAEDFQEPKGAINQYHSAVTTLFPKEDLAIAADRAYEVSAAEPRDNLDQSVQTLAPPLKSVWTNMGVMRDYIHNKEYVEDNYAKARELHKKIMAEAPKVEAAVGPFMAALAAQEVVMREKSMKEMLADGLKIRAGMLDVLNKAEEIMNYLNSKNISNDNIKSLNIEEFKPLYLSLSEAIKRLEETATDDQIKAEKITGVSDYIKVAKETRTQAAAMIENIQSNKLPARISSSTPGTPEKYANQFSLLVSRYNEYISRMR